MINIEKQSLGWQNEWQTLHNNHESYEQYALVIKLIAIIIFSLNLIFEMPVIIAISLLLILWLQEGIWKTYQSRIAKRIILIENEISGLSQDTQEKVPFQLYSSWQKEGTNGIDLVKEYISNALKPTVIYPYIILVLLNIASILL